MLRDGDRAEVLRGDVPAVGEDDGRESVQIKLVDIGMPKEDTQFKPGHKGIGGRPKGSKSGRAKLLELVESTVDGLLDEEEVREAVYESFRSALMRNAVGFWVKVGLPSMPKELLVKHTGDEKAILRLELVKSNGKDKTDDKS